MDYVSWAWYFHSQKLELLWETPEAKAVKMTLSGSDSEPETERTFAVEAVKVDI